MLRRLVDEVGESCNITALSGSEVLYLDRVETPAPLRFYLRSGSRVPSHCSASGKLFLSQMSSEQRSRLLAHVSLERFTPKTVTDFDLLEREFKQIRKQGYALDDEEFLPGLFCIAVMVPGVAAKAGSALKSNMGIAVQAPVMRVNRKKAISFLPALRRAAQALADINAGNLQATIGSVAACHVMKQHDDIETGRLLDGSALNKSEQAARAQVHRYTGTQGQ